MSTLPGLHDSAPDSVRAQDAVTGLPRFSLKVAEQADATFSTGTARAALEGLEALLAGVFEASYTGEPAALAEALRAADQALAEQGSAIDTGLVAAFTTRHPSRVDALPYAERAESFVFQETGDRYALSLLRFSPGLQGGSGRAPGGAGSGPAEAPAFAPGMFSTALDSLPKLQAPGMSLRSWPKGVPGSNAPQRAVLSLRRTRSSLPDNTPDTTALRSLLSWDISQGKASFASVSVASARPLSDVEATALADTLRWTLVLRGGESATLERGTVTFVRQSPFNEWLPEVLFDSGPRVGPTVGTIPEPGVTAMTVALVALGAALARRRKG